MGNYEKTREQVFSEFENKDLRGVALTLTDTIEYMSNTSSNLYEKKGIYSFDLPEIEDMIERAKSQLKSIVLVE